jgi:hypothetical protein
VALVEPIVVVNRPDGVAVYETADAVTGHLEPWYAEEEDFDAYDAEGRHVELRVERRPAMVGTFRRRLGVVDLVVPVAVEGEPRHADELRAALVDALTGAGCVRDELRALALPELLDEARRRLDVVPWRRRRSRTGY